MNQAPPSIVDLESVTKVYRQGNVDVHALRGLSLQVRAGDPERTRTCARVPGLTHLDAGGFPRCSFPAYLPTLKRAASSGGRVSKRDLPDKLHPLEGMRCDYSHGSSCGLGAVA